MSFTDGQDQLKIGRAIRAINLTSGTVAQDQMMLIWDNPSNSFKFVAQPSTSLSQVQFLASQAALGNLILVQGSVTTGISITTYTPPNGKKFTYVTGSANINENNTVGAVNTVTLRNNGTVRERHTLNDSTGVSIISQSFYFRVAEGDLLTGDGVKIYDLFVESLGVGNSFAGQFEGYIV